MRADLRRRSVLAATVMTVPLVVGCKGVGGLGTLPKARPDVAVLRDAIGTEQALIARYRSAMAGAPSLDGTLGPLLDQHREHLARLRSMLITPPSARTTPRPAPTASAAGSPATLAALEAAEADAASALVSRLALAPPALAQLLASIAACEASHALLLRTHGTSR